MKAINLTKQEFIKQIADYEANPKEWKFLGQRPALIDFFASWCGPCKMLSPIIDEIAEEYEGKVDIYKVNVDDESELANLFKVRSIPTLVFIPMQGSPQISHGALPKSSIKEHINKILLK